MFETYPDVLSISEIQMALGIGRNSVYKLVRTKKLKSLKIGKKIRIPKSCLIDFLCQNCYTVDDVNEQIESNEKEG